MGTLLGVHFWPSKRLPCANPGALLRIYVPMYIHDQDFNHFLFMCVHTDVCHHLPNIRVWEHLGGPFCPAWRLVCANTGALLRMYVPMHAHDHNFNHTRCFLCLCACRRPHRIHTWVLRSLLSHIQCSIFTYLHWSSYVHCITWHSRPLVWRMPLCVCAFL